MVSPSVQRLPLGFASAVGATFRWAPGAGLSKAGDPGYLEFATSSRREVGLSKIDP